MKIEFLEVKFKNFLSYPNDFSTITLNSHKTNLICGKNGSGKTALLDVFSFALYNKPFRKDVNKPELVNEINNRDCLVELKFVIGCRKYLLRRGIRPNIFEIFENGVLLPGRADSVDYQEIFEKQILRCSHKSFLQTVILGAGNYVQFMQLTVPQRREVIESLLDLKVFSAMGVTIKQGLAEINTKMADNRSEKVLLDREIDLIEQNQRLQDECNAVTISEKELVKVRIQEDIDGAESSMYVYKMMLDGFVGVPNRMENTAASIIKYEGVREGLAAKKTKLNSEILFLQDHESCHVCGQSIDERFRDMSVDVKCQKLTELEDANRKIGKKLNELEEQRVELAQIETKRQECINNLLSETFRVEQWTMQLKNLDEEIVAIRVKMEAAQTRINIEPLEFKMEMLFKEYNQLEDDKYQQSVALDLLPLIKAAVIKKYIPFFNKQIILYLQKFDSLIRFVLNEYFEETILYRGRDKLGYGSLSEGEKFRVNLAVLFAWRAVARSRGSVDCNLLFLDEIMDSSLDAEGVENFLRIIQHLDDATCVYVISHKDGDFVDSFSRVLEVRKQSNFSRIITT